MPKIKVSLNTKSIDEAIRQLKEYQSSLPAKLERLRQRVADELAAYMRIGFNGAEGEFILYEGYQVPNVGVYVKEDGEITIVYTDASMAAWVIEFGSGVYYNPGGSGNPLAPPGLVPIGQWGKGYGSRPVWGYYEGGKTDDPEENKRRLRLTHGTPASMPIYHAIQAIVPRIPQIAREVFGGGG